MRSENYKIVVKNRERYYFINIYKCKEVPLSIFSYQMLALTFDSDEWSSYYKVYDFSKFLSLNSALLCKNEMCYRIAINAIQKFSLFYNASIRSLLLGTLFQ